MIKNAGSDWQLKKNAGGDWQLKKNADGDWQLKKNAGGERVMWNRIFSGLIIFFII